MPLQVVLQPKVIAEALQATETMVVMELTVALVEEGLAAAGVQMLLVQMVAPMVLKVEMVEMEKHHQLLALQQQEVAAGVVDQGIVTVRAVLVGAALVVVKVSLELMERQIPAAVEVVVATTLMLALAAPAWSSSKCQ